MKFKNTISVETTSGSVKLPLPTEFNSLPTREMRKQLQKYNRIVNKEIKEINKLSQNGNSPALDALKRTTGKEKPMFRTKAPERFKTKSDARRAYLSQYKKAFDFITSKTGTVEGFNKHIESQTSEVLSLDEKLQEEIEKRISEASDISELSQILEETSKYKRFDVNSGKEARDFLSKVYNIYNTFKETYYNLYKEDESNSLLSDIYNKYASNPNVNWEDILEEVKQNREDRFSSDYEKSEKEFRYKKI